jgi:membrane protease YdiL (CAAX protease family)
MFPKNILHFIFLVLLAILISSPFIYILDKYSKGNQKVLIFSIIFYTLFIAIFHIINRIKKNKTSYKFYPIDYKKLLFSVIVVWLLSVVILLPIRFYFFPIETSKLNISSILAGLLIAPIFEEILFRNILLKSLLQTYSSKKSIIISAFIFALIHVNLQQIILGLFIGLYFGFIFSKDFNIAVTIILHFFVNLFGFIGRLILIEFNNSMYLELFFIINLIVTLTILFFLYSKVKHIFISNTTRK